MQITDILESLNTAQGLWSQQLLFTSGRRRFEFSLQQFSILFPITFLSSLN